MNVPPTAAPAPMLDPAPLMQMSFSFAASRILSTAVQLDILFATARTISEHRSEVTTLRKRLLLNFFARR